MTSNRSQARVSRLIKCNVFIKSNVIVFLLLKRPEHGENVLVNKTKCNLLMHRRLKYSYKIKKMILGKTFLVEINSVANIFKKLKKLKKISKISKISKILKISKKSQKS